VPQVSEAIKKQPLVTSPQAGEPCQRYSEDTTVAEVYPEAVFVEADSGWAN
jgi:hypothetical protein